MFSPFVFVIKYKVEASRGIYTILPCTAINRYLVVLHVHRMAIGVTKSRQTTEASNLSC